MSEPKINTAVGDMAVANLPSQHSIATKLIGLIRAFVAPVVGGSPAGLQAVEDALWGALLNRWIATASGKLLDAIGVIVGKTRNSTNDEIYRQAIYLQVGINTSQGTPSRLIDIAKKLSGATMAHYMTRVPKVAEIYLHQIESWSWLGTVYGAAPGGTNVVITGSETPKVFVFGYEVDESGSEHGAILPYGYGFDEYISVEE